MTSEASALDGLEPPEVGVDPAPAEYRAFFELLELPAALCREDGRIRHANAAFRALCGGGGEPGSSLLEALGSPVPPPSLQAGAQELRVSCHGRPVRLSISQRAGLVAVLAHPSPPELREDPAAGLLELSRRMAGVSSEEVLVASVARGMKRLFPGAVFCVRIIEPGSRELSSLYAEGRIKDGARGPLVLKRTSLEKAGLSEHLEPLQVTVVEDDVPTLFEGTHSALSAPLAANGQLFGALTVEYPAGHGVDLGADHRLLLQLANQVSVAVRNVKLIEELTFMRSYLEELLEGANALIIVIDSDLRVVLFNRALRELTGLSMEQVIGAEVISLLPRRQRPQLEQMLSLALQGEELRSYDLDVSTQGKKGVRVSLALSAVRNAAGEVEGLIAIGQDLTHLRQLEQRMIQAEKLASLGQLAATVAHEINNPMTAVSTYAGALLERARSGGAQADAEKLQKILEASDRILRFTRDLTTYSRPDQKHEALEPVDLKAVVELAVGFCDHVVAGSGVLLVRALDGAALPIHAVQARLIQVFVNLITNACHATASGGRVTLRSRAEGDDAVVEVEDTGSGIDAASLERIFDPFFTTKPRGKGTGLGLSIVQGIVESHGGSIQVRSEPGAGTTFTVRLPLRPA